MGSNNYIPITVVIPCFRCATTVDRAVQSIVKQTQKPIEVILVDDASGDDTIRLLSEIEQHYSGWVRVITVTENQGAASARNAGWASATQPYIAFLDADDSWHHEKLCIQYGYMQNNPDVALCGHQCVYLRDRDSPPVIKNNDLIINQVSQTSLLFKNAFSTPTVMLKREIPFRFQKGKRYAEDLLLWQQIAFAGLPVRRIESPLAYVHKPLYGVGGLSAQLWKMERDELDNFVVLYQKGNANLLLYILATCFSIAKFIKRLLVTKLKGLAKFTAGR